MPADLFDSRSLTLENELERIGRYLEVREDQTKLHSGGCCSAWNLFAGQFHIKRKEGESQGRMGCYGGPGSKARITTPVQSPLSWWTASTRTPARCCWIPHAAPAAFSRARYATCVNAT